MLNFWGRMAAEALAAQGQSSPPADPLAPPQNRNDPRIAVAKRGYRSNCWVWQDDATADAARQRVWQEQRRRLPEQLVSRCGHPRCVRQSHLVGFGQREYQRLTRIRGHIERAAGDRDGVARAATLIKSISQDRGDISHKDWAALLNVSLADFEAGLAQDEQAAAAETGAGGHDGCYSRRIRSSAVASAGCGTRRIRSGAVGYDGCGTRRIRSSAVAGRFAATTTAPAALAGGRPAR